MNSSEKIYLIIAGNVRRERKKQCISQAGLAERADISIDTIKSVENGRRAMSLDTYLRIVQALGTSPMALMDREQHEEYMERFFYLIARRNEGEIEFALHMVEQLLRGRDSYLTG